MMVDSAADINWRRVCLNLQNNYKNLAEVAREINSDQQHLARLARGEVKCPRWVTGHKLLDLHLDVCGDLHNNNILGNNL